MYYYIHVLVQQECISATSLCNRTATTDVHEFCGFRVNNYRGSGFTDVLDFDWTSLMIYGYGLLDHGRIL